MIKLRIAAAYCTKILIVFLVFTVLFEVKLLEGKLQDHFKKIDDKSDNHKLKNIDFIYMINLDERPEKWEKSCNQLNPYGIFPYRFSAVNGWQLSLEQVNDVGLKYNSKMKKNILGTTYHLDSDFQPSHEMISEEGQAYFVHCMSRGAIGIVLSHLSILQDAYDSGYETIWVMEDDIKVIQDPTIISTMIEKLDKILGHNNWDILFTDRDIKGGDGKNVPCSSAARRPDFNPSKSNAYSKRVSVKEFVKIGARYGATSMIYRRSGIEKLLNFFKEHSVFLPYDMDYYLPLGINLYSTKKDVVTNLSDAISDNGGANYLNKKK